MNRRVVYVGLAAAAIVILLVIAVGVFRHATETSLRPGGISRDQAIRMASHEGRNPRPRRRSAGQMRGRSRNSEGTPIARPIGWCGPSPSPAHSGGPAVAHTTRTDRPAAHCPPATPPWSWTISAALSSPAAST